MALQPEQVWEPLCLGNTSITNGADVSGQNHLAELLKHSLFQRGSFFLRNPQVLLCLAVNLMCDWTGGEAMNSSIRISSHWTSLWIYRTDLSLLLHLGNIRSLLSGCALTGNFAHRRRSKNTSSWSHHHSLTCSSIRSACGHHPAFIHTLFSELPLCMNMEEITIFECYQLFSSFVANASIPNSHIWMSFYLNSCISLFSVPSCVAVLSTASVNHCSQQRLYLGKLGKLT